MIAGRDARVPRKKQIDPTSNLAAHINRVKSCIYCAVVLRLIVKS
jgi:hypothetical protein